MNPSVNRHFGGDTEAAKLHVYASGVLQNKKGDVH